MKRFVISLAVTFGIIFGGALWFHVMALIFGPENAFVYAIMEVAAVLIAAIVWAVWNMISPEKEEKDKTVRIELIGRDLFKYEGDRIEKVGSMWDAKDWMEPLMKKTDWDQCMAAIDDRNRRETIQKLARQMDYRKAREEKEKEVMEVELRNNFAADTYELVVKYEDGSVKIQPIDPMAIFEYGGVGKYLKDLERRLGLEFEIKTSL